MMRFVGKLNMAQAAALGLLIVATHLGAFVAGRAIVASEARSKIDEANRRIEHLNERLKAALDVDVPQACPVPTSTT